MTTELIRYDAMCRAIEEAHAVDEVKDIRDKAMALEHYASQALNYEAEKRAAEIRIRAERKAGRLLKEMEKAKGAREPGTNRGMTQSNDATASKTLNELGISKDQSSRFQQLVEVPEEEFEEAFNSPQKATTAGILNRHKAKTEPEPIFPSPTNNLALTVWGEIRDLHELADLEAETPVPEAMTDLMLLHVDEVLPGVIAWLNQLQRRIRDERHRRERVADTA